MSDILYLSRQVFWYRPNFQEVLPGQMDDTEYSAAAFGVSVPWRATSGPKRTIEIPYRLTRVEARGVRSFIARHQGRRLGFWLPVWLNDYALTTDYATTATELVVRRSGLSESLDSFTQYSHLALVDADGRMECHAISSVVAGTDTETITLSSGILAAASSKTTQVAGLMFVRLEKDELEWEYATTESIAVAIRFTELPTEYTTAHAGTSPLYLYEFSNSTSIWRFTNWGATITYNGYTWTAGSIAHGEITYGTELLSDELEMEVATDDATHPLRLFAVPKLQSAMSVKIYQTDLDVLAFTTAEPLFQGRIQEVNFEEHGKVSLKLSSILRVGEQSIPRIMVQRTCNHRLFDLNCALVPASFSATGTISAITDSYVEAAAFQTKLDALNPADGTWFSLGRVTVGTELRVAVGGSGNRIYIDAPFLLAEVGDGITATAGCDGRTTTCRDRFNNLDHCIAFPYLPNQNPQFTPLQTPEARGGKK